MRTEDLTNNKEGGKNSTESILISAVGLLFAGGGPGGKGEGQV